MKWLRWYEGTTEDGKFRMVARNASVTVATVIGVWAALLEDAAHEDHRGVSVRQEAYFAAVLDIDEGTLQAILAAMDGAGLISVGAGAITINKWKERQFETDRKDNTNAERQRRHREKRQRNGTVTAETRPDTDTDTDTDTDSSHPSVSEAAREADGGQDDPFFVKCKAALNGTTGRAIDIVRNADGPYGTKAGAAQWLAELIDDTSPDAVVQAIRFVEVKRDRNEPVSNPKAIIAKTAQTVVANARQPKEGKPSASDWSASKANRGKALLDWIKTNPHQERIA
jgi:hypothetical protein